MPNVELQSLASAVAEARSIFAIYANGWADDRLADLEHRLLNGDSNAVVWAISESTGSGGSLNDRWISPANGDNISDRDVPSVNERLRSIVHNIEQEARIAAKTLNITLVR